MHGSADTTGLTRAQKPSILLVYSSTCSVTKSFFNFQGWAVPPPCVVVGVCLELEHSLLYQSFDHYFQNNENITKYMEKKKQNIKKSKLLQNVLEDKKAE